MEVLRTLILRVISYLMTQCMLGWTKFTLALYFLKTLWFSFIFGQISLSDHGLHGGQKIELAKKIHAEKVDVKCMQANIGGHGYFDGGQKIELAQKIYVSKGWCEILANQF